MAHTRNPQAVQPHLRKCFDAITRLEFALLPQKTPDATRADLDSEQDTIYSKEILKMVSPEGEMVSFDKSQDMMNLKCLLSIPLLLCLVFLGVFLLVKRNLVTYSHPMCFQYVSAYLGILAIICKLFMLPNVCYCVSFQVSLNKGVKAQGNVENWLCKVEEAMFSSLRHLSKAAIADYQVKSRDEWVVAGHPSQVKPHKGHTDFTWLWIKTPKQKRKLSYRKK